MNIKITANYLTITNINNRAIEILSNLLTVKVPGYFFSTAYKLKQWDGTKKFYWLKNNIFTCQSGFSGLIENELSKHGLSYELENQYIPDEDICYEDIELKGIELRPEQIEVLYEMNRLGRGILRGKTGSGKTECAIAFAKQYLDNNDGVVLFLTHRKSIFEQIWQQRLNMRLDVIPFKGEYSQIKKYSYTPTGIETCNGRKIIVLAMTQTLMSHIKELNWLKNVKVVFCDECHATETYTRKSNGRQVYLFHHISLAYHRFGMSATPFRKKVRIFELYHKYQTICNFGDIIEFISESKIKVKIGMIKVPYYNKPIDYQEALKNSKYNSQKIDSIKLILCAMKNKNRKTLIFTKYIDHGTLLSEELGIPFIYSKTSSKERLEKCQEFENGKYNALIVSGIFYFGINIPAIDTIIFAHIEKSYINIIQSIGRGRREFENKTELQVFDFYDNDDSYLERHSKQRLSHYKSMNYEVERINE